MKFIKLTVKNHTVMHGFDKDNKEILEKCEADKTTTKMKKFIIYNLKSVCYKVRRLLTR